MKSHLVAFQINLLQKMMVFQTFQTPDLVSREIDGLQVLEMSDVLNPHYMIVREVEVLDGQVVDSVDCADLVEGQAQMLESVTLLDTFDFSNFIIFARVKDWCMQCEQQDNIV